jgi:pyruvate kinase
MMRETHRRECPDADRSKSITDMGKYPVEAVQMLASIGQATEPHRRPVKGEDLFGSVGLRGRLRPPDLIAVGVQASLARSSLAAVFVPTRSGATARSLSLLRLPVWIVAISSDPTTCRDLQFSYGVFPVHEAHPPYEWTSYVKRWIRDHGLAGDLAVVRKNRVAIRPG